MYPRTQSMLRALLAGGVLGVLSACATLPASGPTAGDIRHHTDDADAGVNFQIVNITAPVLADVLDKAAVAEAAQPTLASLAVQSRTDVVGPGDVLSIGIYEVGVSLFGGGRDMTTGFDPSARGENFPAVVVDRGGSITLPFIGRLQVAGRPTDEIQDMIVRAMKGKSQSPQALVTLRTNLTNTVYVGGDVRRSGRLDLSLQHERLLDAIALSGGSTATSEDTLIRFSRGSRTLEERLGRIRAGSADDLVLAPGDRIELIRRPRSFVILGASGKVSQVAFETGDVSLAEAVARAGGPVDVQADPRAIFLFRYDAASPSGATPRLYRLDMMRPASYFLSQRFTIQDKDVIYIANAAANRPTKMIAIINQLFGPLITARALAQ